MTVYEEVPSGPVRPGDAERAGLDPELELDLDEPAVPPPAATPAGRDHRAARWHRARPLVVAGLVGALLGGGLLHVVERARERGESALTVALGESGARLLNRPFGSRRVIHLSTLAVNEGASALTVRGVRVEGDGAAAIRTYRGEASIYPFRLEPGQTANMPITVAADCDVRSPVPPRVTVDVTAEDGTRRAVEVRIPGLAAMWRRATTPDACSIT